MPPVSKNGLGLAAAILLCFAAPRPATAAGFFDDVPSRGYVRADVAYDVLRQEEGVERTLVARIRFVTLLLDPGTRDIALDRWPLREMLLVEHASGERVVFERLSRLQPPRYPDEPRPQARIGLDGGSGVEMVVREDGASVRGPQACSGGFAFLRVRERELPVAPEDLSVPTVRTGIARFLEAGLDARERELITRTAQIALRANQTKSLPIGPLEILRTIFPGRSLGTLRDALVFEVTSTPIDPSGSGWSSVTETPEMLPGDPAF